MLAIDRDVWTWTSVSIEPGAELRCFRRADEPHISLTLGREEQATLEIASDMVGALIDALSPYRTPADTPA